MLTAMILVSSLLFVQDAQKTQSGEVTGKVVSIADGDTIT